MFPSSQRDNTIAQIIVTAEFRKKRIERWAFGSQNERLKKECVNYLPAQKLYM
jgi:hypothetical protein